MCASFKFCFICRCWLFCIKWENKNKIPCPSLSNCWLNGFSPQLRCRPSSVAFVAVVSSYTCLWSRSFAFSRCHSARLNLLALHCMCTFAISFSVISNSIFVFVCTANKFIDCGFFFVSFYFIRAYILVVVIFIFFFSSIVSEPCCMLILNVLRLMRSLENASSLDISFSYPFYLFIYYSFDWRRREKNAIGQENVV